ncbi:MAG: HAMP domain-containing protein [Magnetococcales bacterium]|nr:HAMP domain-containing protein [Magnetococcales bacterium]
MRFILNQLKNIAFTKKLYYLIFMLFIKLLVVVGTLGGVYWLNLQEANRDRSIDQLSELTWDLVAQLHELNGNVTRYVLRHEETDQAWVERDMPKLLADFARLQREQTLLKQWEGVHLQTDFQHYADLVRLLFRQIDRYGENEEKGVQGEMRGTIHQVERLLESHPLWGFQLLNIRRSEKDFMLRMEEGYVVALHQRVSALLAEVGASSDANREQITQRLIEYQEKFQELSTLVLSIQKNTNEIHALWDAIADGITALRVDTQKMREDERLRYHTATDRLAVALLVGVVLILLLTGTLLSSIFYGNILKPIRQLTERAYAIAQGDYDQDISLSGRDEVGVLASHLQRMKESLQQANRTLEQQVAERTALLTQSNTDLRQSFAQLERARDELVQSEKVALLGRLVAGFAHEINTPIGVGVGSISALPDYVNRLEVLLSADEVDGDALDRVMAKIREMANLCLSNLRNVADLVARFKRTSVDQTSEQPRRFNVHEFMLDVVSTLQHMFKRSAVEIVIDCPTDLVVQSQPGALGQVLTNLLMNSFKHGFDEGQRAGTIQIHVQCIAEDDTVLVIWFSDNGKGMTPHVLDHIFEPFFSTAKGQGGSGLGLYICYNIIRNQLLGKMVCSSIPGHETAFLMEIPVTGEVNDQKNCA